MKNLLYLLLCFSLLGACKVKQEQTIDLKIMSYNIRHGKGLDTILDLSRAAAIIKNQAPDLCGLQEVDHFIKRSDSVDQTGYLARETKMKGTFGKFMAYQNGEYGMATLSAKPLTSTKILQLPDGKYEPRTSIVHEVALAKDCTIVFANVHFDWISGKEGSANRLNQAKALVAYIDSLQKATIITGDFNCTPDSPTMQYFAEQGFVFVEKGADNLSFQGEETSEIDHLIYRNSDLVKFKSKSIQLLDEPIGSDHRPLVVELEVTF
ncbi:endonuclease/exonuclease/phosphatase family metal-dependent hydrolase [Gelidibacter sediminis]|uniref:Endonuclease/exonuclease/phosphatase family metal-dependent hydrolase n=1 Tax=Gelidibacter sediminis TaxID=1608710 RepID=A0A4R7PIX1_9FLAO|nr:endonuclease/exonuclease/phosphatase family protein [Gelidibacter sediminis]TDU34308.1 endonuclease/exonuclease/phosphatase family metal-dependent hydrolase [Gelidibacter sediminis]